MTWDGIERRDAKEHILAILKDAKIARLERENNKLKEQLKQVYEHINKEATHGSN